MDVRTRFASLLAVSLVATVATACSGASARPTDPAGDTVRVLAPVESVEVRIAQSSPPRYFADIVSALPNGCARFESLETARDGDTIRIAVWNLAPAPGSLVACTMIYGLTEHHADLGVDFQTGRTYTVVVNGETASFQAR